MRRLPKTHKKLPMKKEDEPDFYKMDKECSLPPLEEITLSPPNKMRSGVGGPPPHAFSPVANGHGLQKPNGLPPRMFPEGITSQEGFDPQDGCFLGGRRQCRSPNIVGGPGIPGMRDPASFKNMEFKPVTMEMNAAGFGGHMGSQMMQMSGMMAPQMNQGMMSAQMGSGMMNHQMGSQMMGSQMMSTQMMGTGMMNSGMMGPQMGTQMGSQMCGHMVNPMGGQMDQFQNLQRLRQIQQMQLLDRQMNPVAVGGDDAYGRMGSFHQHC